MKQISGLIIIIVAILTAMFVISLGSNKVVDDVQTDRTWIRHDRSRNVITKIVEIDCHKYIMMVAERGCSIIHAASCNCMNK